MKAYGEGIIVGGALSAAFGIAAGEQQAEVCGFMGVGRKFAAGGVDDFGQNDSAEFKSVFGCAVKLAGLQRVAHKRC